MNLVGYPSVDFTYRRSLLRILTIVLGGGFHETYGKIEWLSKQAFPDTAEGAILERWSTIWKVLRRQPEKASGYATVSGVGDSTISKGEILKRSDGFTFEVDDDYQLPSGAESQLSIGLIAQNGGLNGNTDPGASLLFESPPAGLNPTGQVDSPGLSGGTDKETDASLLERLLARIQRAAHGGAYFDYPTWCKEVANVTRAWCSPLYDPDGGIGYGYVGVSFVMDEKTSYPDLVRMGSFAEDSPYWYKETDASGGWSIINGKAACDGAQTANVALYQDIKAEEDRTYRVKFTASDSTTGTLVVKLGDEIVVTLNSFPAHNTDYNVELAAGGGANEGQIRFEADSSFDGKIDNVSVEDEASPIVPGAAELDLVQEYLGTPSSQTGVRPVCAHLIMIQLKAKKVDFDITLIGSTGDDVKLAVQAELEDLLYRKGYPAGTMLVSQVREAISMATGETDHTLNSINGITPANVSAGTAEVLTLGTITWS